MAGKLSESDKKVVNDLTDQEAIRATYPRHTVKWLARLMGIPLPTARFWTERTVPVYRQADLGLLLIEEFHEHTKWREEKLLPKLMQMAGLVNEVEILPASSVTRAAIHLVDATAAGFEAAIKWIEE